MIQKQTAYIPTSLSDKESNQGTLYNTHTGHQSMVSLRRIEAFVFTPEQLNEYTANIIKQALEAAADKATVTPIDHEEISKGSFRPIWEVNDESITNTFEETFKRFKHE